MPQRVLNENFAPSSPAYQPLTYSLATQEQSNWCWAAVTCAINDFYPSKNHFTQCDLVSRVLQRACCNAPNQCDEPWYLDRALYMTAHYSGMYSGRVSKEYLHDMINIQRRPVCMQIEWNGGDIGHVVTIIGISPSGVLYIADPHFQYVNCLYDTFPDDYQGTGGRWLYSFETV
ncbi:papain-like cysteine protease family protein [Hymenobacter setariae]